LTDTATGSGRTNTGLVLESCGQNTAAGMASDYRGGGLDDWYLPAKDERNVMFQRRALIGGMDDSYVWSSSQVSNSPEFAWTHNFFAGGKPEFNYKGSVSRVRPTRAF
jgi:hypothetical protein